MAFNRATSGNENGVTDIAKGLDPLERHTFMIPKSMANLLEQLAYESKEKTNKSKLVREALAEKYETS